MRKRLLALLLAFAMVLGMMPAAAFPVSAEDTVTPPFTSITTEDGEAVSYSYKGAIPASTSWASYEDGPYYHVTIPEGTENVLVTYPADVGIAGAPSAYSYTLSVPDYELGYGSAYFTVETNDDGSNTVTIPVAAYLLTDGTGTAMSLEAEGTFDPITFFSFSYAEDETDPEPEEPTHTCVFDQKVTDEKYLATAADCTNAATYYYSCTCGEKGEDTFSDGEALGHEYEDGKCTVCGAEDPDNILYSGVFGEDDCLSWVLDKNGKLTVSGNGKFPTSLFDIPWYDYKKQIKSVVIESGVTELQGSAFDSCSNLETVSLPDTVTVIGGSTFASCEKLTEVTIPDNVTSIGANAFKWCKALQSVNIPEKVTEIGSYAFYCCKELTAVVIPDSVTTLGESAFSGCYKLASVTLSKNLEKLSDNTFYYCKVLTSIVIPDKVTKIWNSVFEGTALESVVIGDNVEYMGAKIFNECTKLKSVTIGKKVNSMNWSEFGGCTALEEVHFTGSAPTFNSSSFFKNVTATVYYPCNDESWTEEICTATFGDATELTWVKEHSYEDGKCTVCGEDDPESAVNALSALSFHSTYSASDTDYVLVPAFDPAVKEYNLVAHDSKNACYAKATLAEGVEGTITAAWVNLNNNDSRTATLTSSAKTLTGAVKTGNYNNTVVVTVTDGDENVIDTYTVNIVRTPSLTGLALEGMKLNESFVTTTTAYTASTAADSVTVAATPRDESYTVTVNGKEDTTVALNMGENVITVAVKNEDGYEATYTITVTRKESISVSFDVNVENPRITLTDANKTVIAPVEGVYTLISGETYSYTVQCDGYIGQTNEFTLTESGTIEIELEAATENPDLDKTIYAQWANFRNGPNHLGITSAATPYDPEDAELLWAAKYGTGWSAAPGSPIIVDGDIITYVGSSIKRLDRNTGAILAEGTMVASSSYSIVPATYADGMIFVGLSGGKIQAFNAATLESLWVYTDELKGQPNCPITYKDGYIYAGFWNSETKDANFVCIYTIDEDHESTTEAKLASWTYTRTGGFYWAGAYVSDKFAVVGTDDGASGYTTEGASLLVFDRLTGDLVDSYNGLRGDIRSNVSYDPSSDRVFFTSKGGILCNAKVDWETGKISDFHQTVIQDANGNANAMSTCTPSVYNGRIYIGVCGTSQFGDNSGHGIAVYDLNADGSMTQAYVYAIKGYPQTSAMVTTAYADTQEGYVYIYLPYNSTPGGISVLKDKKGQTEPMTTTDEGYSEVFTPVSPLAQYCICSTIADEYGTIYYKNDSCYMMAITSRIESLELETEPTFTVNEDGEWSYTGLKAVTHQVNGTTRDVTEYVDVAYDTETGAYSVSYTYGFDSDNYGLKTLTVYSVSIPEGDGYTVKGETTANSWEPYTFTVDTLATFEKTDAFAVKVNGEAIEPNEDGSYTVKEVSGSLTITVEGLEAITLNITVYYADNGTIVVGDDADKTLLNFAPVTVTDANGDGQFTMYDGFYCFHEQYHANGAAGYTDSNWVTQFWSVSTAMVSYGHNNRWVFSTADEIADGDSLCLYTYQDQLSWSDLYTYFDNLTTTATVNEEASFHVNGYSFFGSGSNMDAIANPVGATVTATCGDKTLTTTTNAEGNFKLTFPSAGEWTILVNGKCSYTCDVGYYQGQTYTDAPVTPAMMTVTVEAPSHTVTLPVGDGYTVTPAKDYTTSVKDGKDFKFTVATSVGYQKGDNFAVKANGEPITGSNGTYTLKNVTGDVTISVEGVEKIVWKPVTVYFSLSEDDQYQVGKESGEVMALRKISVPYFDLGLYGLEDFYFSSETYSSDGGEHSSDLLPGTAEYAYGKITLLHLYIYALEVYYCDVDADEAGKGYLYEQGLLGTEVLNISGSAGSIFMNDFWGMDLNLNYYVNYVYPLASEGWGSTSDQILLRENDVITLGHFTSWSFFNDPTSIFNYLTPDEDNKVYGTTTVTQGDKLTLTGYHAGAGENYATDHTKLTSELTVYYALYDNVEQDVTEWTELDNLSADGTITIDTSTWAPGTYVVAMAGQYGAEITTDICSTPGGILVVVEENTEEPGSDVIPGDLSGDGKITTLDASMLQMHLKGKTTLTEEQLAAADVNGDGKVTAVDYTLMKMYIKNKLESFPKAK